MSRFARAALLAALLLWPFAGPAHGFGRWAWTTSSYSYYPTYYSPSHYYPAYYTPVYTSPIVTASVSYPAPVWVYAAVPVVCSPAVTTPAPAYATPTAAPPSQTVEPPTARPAPPAGGPTVTESNASAAAKPASPGGAAGSCRVGFWNLTGRDVTLTVDGQARQLPRNQSITLTLGRQFVWQVDRRTAQSENIPDANCTLEIVMRK